MKRTLLTCLAALTLLPGTARADGGAFPGNPDEPFYAPLDQERYCGHVLEACFVYVEAIREARRPHAGSSVQERAERVAEARQELIKRVEMYPDEINDTYWAHHAFEMSPLYAAVIGNDDILVKFMLDQGALPFFPDYSYEDLEISKDVQALLSQARRRYNVLEICLKARKAGIDLEGEEPSRKHAQ